MTYQMRKLPLIIIMLCGVLTLHAQETYTSEIKLQRNERWWGLWAGGNRSQPFPLDGGFSVRTDSCGRDFFTVSMMVSGNGRYIWSRYPMDVAFDGKKFLISSEHEKVEVKQGGNTLREAYLVCYHNNLRDNGGVPPEELFTGPVYDLSLDDAASPDAETISVYVDRILGEGLPAGTVLLPRGWESLARRGDFNRDLYPDPRNMIAGLHEKGFRVMVTLTPYVAASGRNYADALRDGRLLTDGDGTPLLFGDRRGYYAVEDFSSEDVAAGFAARAAGLRDEYGVDGFLFDCREAIPLIKHDDDLLSRFLGNWNGAGREFDMKIYSSAFYAPGSVSATGNPGELSWESLLQAVNDVVISGLCGYIYPYYPTGYITGETDELLLLRAIQLSLMLPVAILPVSAWNMENEAYGRQVKKNIRQRMEMAGYMRELAQWAGSTAEPMARHMAYQFVNQSFWNCPDQFMLGSKYLVAPVTDNSGKRTVRLPRGTWTAPDGTRIKGPRVINADVSDGHALVYIAQ